MFRPRIFSLAIVTAASLIALPAAATAQTSQTSPRTPVLTTPHFRIYSDFDTNLNDALITAGQARRDKQPELFKADAEAPCFADLTASARAGWDRAVDYYAEKISPSDWSARAQFLPRMQLVGFDAEWRNAGPAAVEFVEATRGIRDAAAAAYRACRWATQDAKNRHWIADIAPRLAGDEAAAANRVEALYEKKWPTLPILVDIVETVNFAGASTTWSKAGQGDLLISSLPDGPPAFEVLFHESSHILMETADPVRRALDDAAKAAAFRMPPELWHVVLFYITGEAMRPILDARAPGYSPMLDELMARGVWSKYRDALERSWGPYLRGTRTLADAAAALVAALHPQTIDPLILTALKWRGVNPAPHTQERSGDAVRGRGGRSIAISGVKGRPNEGYFGAAGGGLWKTTDRGEHWTPVTDGQVHSASVGAVAVSESNPDIVFIGMGESCIRGDAMSGDGVYKSIDAGKTWAHVGFEDAPVISKIRIHPTNPDIVFVAAFGKLSAPSETRGIFKSIDGGRTWKRTLFRDAKTAAIDLAIDRHNPQVMFAALWEAYRLEYTMSSGGPGSGLFKSTDGGDTWTEITRRPGLPAGIDGRIGVAISGADANLVYALVENADGGLYRSDDGGATWALVNGGRNIRQRAFYYTHVAADPVDRDVVYVMNVGLFKSTDGGRTLENFAFGDSHDLWIDPDDTAHIMHSMDGGGAVTYDAGVTWSLRDFPTAQYYHVVATAHLPYQICGAHQDGSSVCVSSSARRPVEPYSVGGREPGYIAPDPKNTNVFFAGGNNGSFIERLNVETGESREVGPYPLVFSGQASKDLAERIQWTFPIVFSPVDPRVLYTASQHVWRSTTNGDDWERISGDLTRHDPRTMGDSGGPITHDMNSPEVYATVFALAPGKTDVNVLWAGSDDGVVSVTRDGGKTWANVTPKDMPDFGRVSIIDASSFDPGTAYVAVKKPLLDDFAPYIFRTHDFGRTWTRIVTGLAPGDFVHVVREDPKRRGLLYAGTQHGVSISFDDGAHWQSLSLNLPDVPVVDLIVAHDDLAIATHGRGFYILEQIGLLRQTP